MRCLCCNRNLSDLEATRRHAETGEFLDICNKCIDDCEVPYIDRLDLEDTIEDDETEDKNNPMSEMSRDGERFQGE